MDYFIVLLTILFSAFFSGIEIAFVTANRLEIALDKKQGFLSGKIISWLQKRSSGFISSMLIGNTIALVIYGIFIAKIIEPLIGQVYPNEYFIFIAQTIISTLIILVTAEFLPKSIFKNNSNEFLNIFSPIMILFYFLLAIPSFIMMNIARIILRIFTKKISLQKIEETKFGQIDLDHYLKEATENTSKDTIQHEVQIFQNALEFSSLKARDCMVPRTEIIALDIDESIDELKKTFIETQLSKILIYRESIDNIIGYVHSMELFKNPSNIRSIILPVFIIPETMPGNKVLESFIKKKKSVAIVVDELGGTSGMLTVEDVLEEIVGDIDDEHDQEELIEKKLDENDFIFSARLELYYINEQYELKLPIIEGVETLAGLILHVCEKIPSEGETIVYKDYVFEILKVNDHKIELVKVHSNHH